MRCLLCLISEFYTFEMFAFLNVLSIHVLQRQKCHFRNLICRPLETIPIITNLLIKMAILSPFALARVWGSFNVISKEQPVCAECAPLDPLVVLVIYLGQTVTVKQTLQLCGSKQGVLLYYIFFEPNSISNVIMIHRPQPMSQLPHINIANDRSNKCALLFDNCMHTSVFKDTEHY